MRDMRPLVLPKMVAARRSLSEGSDDRSYPDSSAHSITSEPSTPSTPLSAVFSTRGHKRQSSSTSSLSLSSTPPSSYEHLDSMASGKLPQLEEADEYVMDELIDVDDFPMFNSEVPTPCLCDTEFCAHQGSSNSDSTVSPPPDSGSLAYHYDLSDSYSADEFEMPRRTSKRRRSGVESPVNSIASRFGERFPSLTRRWKNRSRAGSMLSRENTRTSTSTPSGYASTPSGYASSRSSSMTGSAIPSFTSFSTSETELAGSPRDSVVHEEYEEEEDELILLPPPIDMVSPVLAEDPIDRNALASTPLLPPMMVEKRSPKETPLQSPLQSPSIAADSSAFSAMNSPLGTPQPPHVQTPPLSTKASIASFRHGRPGQLVPVADIPPMMIADEHDEWSIKLGHANFTIYPEPYMPEVCDADACRELFANWEQARCNFTKHQVRTGEHFGVTSKTYQLTEEKWAEIDAEWKRNHDAAAARAAELGLDRADCPTPNEPAPLMKMPSLNDAQGAGKFPKLGDEDIVGPMVQIAARIPHTRPSKKAALLKFIGDLKLPGAVIGRASQ
ncbi:uncharacterized protein K452DRAFT_308029 [Aplosporella prunicola CBS 121167]|uniref:Only prolin and serin are matching in the corresponding protein n=1 Tax=Aplosporella prunicola CBS 121167 TaxID=1176127 RepID=A0A6A6BFK2_9PEZI|nr:uncharacterized protein K452DRAFT_308029 [Aplosporella prunicola CBS 121167]KAF2142338.1 hypothetical protein K452DRAFT_308029 [Aplosporella prunicola CBS 121167]